MTIAPTCDRHPDTFLQAVPVVADPRFDLTCPKCFTTKPTPAQYDARVTGGGAVTVGYRTNGSPESVTVALPNGYDSDHAAVFAALVDLAAAYGRATGMDVDTALGDVMECLDSYA